jgi:hypothetical protein
MFMTVIDNQIRPYDFGGPMQDMAGDRRGHFVKLLARGLGEEFYEPTVFREFLRQF